jgi:5-methyltetrahydrofolate--homocysteine methyltransferase
MELKVNTTCGASNISFGLPNRHGLNSSFLRWRSAPA